MTQAPKKRATAKTKPGPKPKKTNAADGKTQKDLGIKGTEPENIDTLEDMAKALKLRRMGASYEEIGTTLGGKTKQWAHKLVKRALAEMMEDCRETVQELRAIENARLDGMTMALQKGINAGDPKAIGAAVRVSERRARINALDAPDKVSLTDTDGNDLGRALTEGSTGLAGLLRAKNAGKGAASEQAGG